MIRRNGHLRINLKTKFSFASILLAAMLCVTLTIVSYNSYKSSMVEKYEDQITSLVNSAAALVNPDKVADYMSSGIMDDEYNRMVQCFRILTVENKLSYLYSYVPKEKGVEVFIQGTSEGEEGHFTLGDFVEYSDEEMDFANRLFDNKDTEKIYVSDGEFGYLITAFCVLYDSDGAPALVVGADLSMERVNQVLGEYLRNVCLIALAVTVFFLFMYILSLRRTVINPLQVLVDSAIKFVSANTSNNENKLAPMHVSVNTGDEIEDLAQAFNQMTADIVKYITEITSTASERERIKTELKVATLIQEGMLPKAFEFPGRNEFSVYASMRPAKDVGGDFYDFFFVNQEQFCIVIGDVSGKGVPAALFMAMAKATIRDYALRLFTPEIILTNANDALCKNNDQGMFVTLFVAIIDLKTGVIQWSDAGHNPTAIWKKDGSVVNMTGKKGFVCAGMEGYKYKLNETKIEKGDILFAYTDGVTEAVNTGLEMYTETKLLETIAQCEKRDVKTLCHLVVNEVDAFAGEEPQFDDITMISFEYKDI